MFENPLFDATSDTDEPPKEIPEVLLDEFTYHGRIDIRKAYFDGTKELGPNWTKEFLEEFESKFLNSYEGKNHLYRLQYSN